MNPFLIAPTKFITNFSPLLAIVKLNQSHPRTSQKHGNRQADGGGQVSS